MGETKPVKTSDYLLEIPLLADIEPSRAIVRAQGRALAPLTETRELIRFANSELARITHGKGDFQDSWLQRVAAALERNWLDKGLHMASGFAAVAAFGAGLSLGVSELVGLGAVLLVPTFAGELTGAAARNRYARGLDRQVTIADVGPAIKRFKAATGLEKAVLGGLLSTWSRALNDGRARGNGARRALANVEREYATIAGADKQRASELIALATKEQA